MNAIRHCYSALSRLCLLSGLLVALALLPWGSGLATPAHAEPVVHDHRGPDARIWIVIRTIHVFDDLDWGDGDIKIDYELRTGDESCPKLFSSPCARLLVRGEVPEFQTTDNTYHTLNRYIPRFGDYYVDPQVSPDIGIPIRLAGWYRLRVHGTEVDAAQDDEMGWVNLDILDDDGQIRFGTHTERGTRAFCELLSPYCATEPATFSVEYEILRADLPDLKPTDIKVLDAPLAGGKKLICAAIRNDGTESAGPFEIAFRIDGTTPPDGTASAGGLPQGQAGELCVETALPAGQHHLAVNVDFADAVFEVSETNNYYEEPYLIGRFQTDIGNATGPGAEAADATDADQSPVFTPRATPVPSPAPSVARADVSVEAIKVNGQVPDGKGDCKDGKNAITVVLKNLGSDDASGFPVRLTVDGNSAGERNVDGLKAGQQHEVRFEDVRLTSGEHKLFATINGKNALATDENNGRTVMAACQSAS